MTATQRPNGEKLDDQVTSNVEENRAGSTAVDGLFAIARAINGLTSAVHRLGTAAIRDGYRTPSSDSDSLSRFLTDCVAHIPGKRSQSSALYSAYVAWAKANNEHEWSASGFSRAMTERGYQKMRSNVIWWLDIELKSQACVLTRHAADIFSQPSV